MAAENKQSNPILSCLLPPPPSPPVQNTAPAPAPVPAPKPAYTYAGEHPCCECGGKAYYYIGADTNKKLYCSRHGPKPYRIALPKRSYDERAFAGVSAAKEHEKTIEPARRTDGKPGAVTLQRMFMMKALMFHTGCVMILPNNRHGKHFMAAFDCCELSPMRLGPVAHGQPGLPPARNIENFHQGSKCYREEMDDKGWPSKLYAANRLAFYNDPEPHRHKYDKGSNKDNKNIPEFFVWIDKVGKEHHLSYVESRQFYCTFYERLASARPEFKRLQKMLADGYNIEICGYDAHPFDPVLEAEAAYMDPSLPFGHERVLAVMLANSDKPELFPWRKHKTFDF